MLLKYDIQELFAEFIVYDITAGFQFQFLKEIDFVNFALHFDRETPRKQNSSSRKRIIEPLKASISIAFFKLSTTRRYNYTSAMLEQLENVFSCAHLAKYGFVFVVLIITELACFFQKGSAHVFYKLGKFTHNRF